MSLKYSANNGYQGSQSPSVAIINLVGTDTKFVLVDTQVHLILTNFPGSPTGLGLGRVVDGYSRQVSDPGLQVIPLEV